MLHPYQTRVSPCKVFVSFHFLSSLPDIPSQERENEYLNGSLNTKMTMNDVTTGNVAEVAAITLFLRSYSDDNLGKRDYNPDKQHSRQFVDVVEEHMRTADLLVQTNQSFEQMKWQQTTQSDDN